MAKTTNKQHARKLQAFIRLIGEHREPFAETGRKFDKVYVDDKVMFFVARMDQTGIDIGDIFGRKTDQSPNLKWYYGNLKNAEKWDWNDPKHPRPVSDESVLVGKKYGKFAHFIKVPSKK